MNIFDVAYTPLDTPTMPKVNVEKLLEWIEKTHPMVRQHNEDISNQQFSAEGRMGDSYPWKLTPVYMNNELISTGWINNFEALFPEVSTYFYSAFGLDLEDLGIISLLPVVPKHTGLGFWHQDPDKLGLRMYLEFDDFDNKLIIRKTKIRYTEQPYQTATDFEILLEDEILDCKILNKNQCFFLNNLNTAHSIYTNVPGKIRIAVLIGEKLGNRDTLYNKIESLVVNSAKKFSDYSIIL